MNHKLLRMLNEAGFEFTPDIMNKLPEFEKLIRLEREECASIEVHLTTPDRDYTNISPLDAYEAALMDAAMAFREAIRARGQHDKLD
jgi:hypothetical protein